MSKFSVFFLVLSLIAGVFIFVLNVSESVTVETYSVPVGAPTHSMFSYITANGNETGIFAVDINDHATFSFGGGSVDVEIQCNFDASSAVIRPESYNITPTLTNDDKIHFTLSEPRKLSIEVSKAGGGIENLFLFADPLETNTPDPSDPNVIVYQPGYHSIDSTINLSDNQILWIKGGAYVDTDTGERAIRIEGGKNITVMGRGVFNGCTRIYNSNNVKIEGITIVTTGKTWMNKIERSQYVDYDGVKVMAGVDGGVNRDGFDIMSGTQKVTINNVFLRAADDAFTIKHHPSISGFASKNAIKNIVMKNSVVATINYGGGLRIGAETIGRTIEDIRMENNDYIHIAAGVFEFRTLDGVHVKDIVINNCRVEADHHDFLYINMDENWYKVGPKRGHVQGLYFNNVTVKGGLNGVTLNGYDSNHMIDDVYFYDVYVDGERMDSLSEMNANYNHIGGVYFNDSSLPSDTTAPVMTEAKSKITNENGYSNKIYVVFSDEIDISTAEKIDNYSLSDGVAITKAEIDGEHASARQVILTTSNMNYGSDYTLTVNNIEDVAGNLVDANSTVDFSVEQSWKPSIDYSDYQGINGWFFEQYNTSDVQIFANRSDLVYPPQYWRQDYYPHPDGERWNGYESEVYLTDTYMCPSSKYNSVRGWVAPVDGTVEITGSVTHSGTSGDEAGVKITRNTGDKRYAKDEETLWGTKAVLNESKTHSLSTTVYEGDYIRFIVEINGTTNNDLITWDPVIKYMSASRPTRASY